MMNPSTSAVTKAAWRFTGVALLLVALGTGTASTETFQFGGSTTTIEQSGGRGTSHSQVIRDPDGQTVITHDGNNTDITVQRRSGASSPEEGAEPPPAVTDRFDRGWINQRFSRRAPERGSADDCPESTGSSRREAFKQRMLERLRRLTP